MIRRDVLFAVAVAAVGAGCVGPVPGDGCTTGTWQRGSLEIHHLDLGQADATLIVSPQGRSLLVDAGEPRWDGSAGAEMIGAYVKDVLGCSHLDYVLLTHFHADHVGSVGVGGLWHLVNRQGFTVGATVYRDIYAYTGERGATVDGWRAYLADSQAAVLHPAVAAAGDQKIQLGGGVSFSIVAADGGGLLRPGNFGGDDRPPNENDYSVAAVLRFGRFDYFTGGDLSGAYATSDFGYAHHDIETEIARRVGDVDVLRVNHHGSGHSSNPTFVAELDPEVSVVSVGSANPYGLPRRSVIERLAATSAVYTTVRAPVVVRTGDGVHYTVNGDAFMAVDPVRVDADGDGYFREADPDDFAPSLVPSPRGGCDGRYQACVAF